MRFDRYVSDPVAFIDDLVKKSELGRPFSLAPHQREILSLAFRFDAEGRLPWDTIIFSCPKKSGKTTINAALCLWWAFTQEPPNEIRVAANDYDQSVARVFKTAARLLRHNPALGRSAEIQATKAALSNGTEIGAIPSDFAGEAGGNFGLTSWDELWGFVSESSRRLWEELTPVPTRKNSIRLVTTYAGWEGESALLQELYRRGVGKDECPDGQGERLHPELPVYANREARLFVYWDHEPRMPWQTPRYYAAQRRALRPGTYLRLHENRWASAEEAFITPEMWDACVDPSLSPALQANGVLYAGVDASTKGDTSAVVAVRWDGGKVALACHKIWRPSAKAPLDLEQTVEACLRDLCRRFTVREVLCDPFQMHRSITSLAGAGIPIREFPQTVGNTTLMGETLLGLLKAKTLRLYPAEDMREQAMNAVAVESPRGWRIAKEKAAKKIDSVVALAMACVSAVENGPRQVDVSQVQLIGPERSVTRDGWYGEFDSTAPDRFSYGPGVHTVRIGGGRFPWE